MIMSSYTDVNKTEMIKLVPENDEDILLIGMLAVTLRNHIELHKASSTTPAKVNFMTLEKQAFLNTFITLMNFKPGY